MSKRFNNSCNIDDSLAQDIFEQPLSDSRDILPPAGQIHPDRVLLFSRKEGFEHRVPSHHDRFVLILTLRGDGAVLLDGRLVDMSANSALLIFPYQFHHFIRTVSPGLSWLFITFVMDNSDGLLPLQNMCFPLDMELLEEVTRMLDDFRNLDLPDQAMSRFVSARLQIILSRLLQKSASNSNSANSIRHVNVVPYDTIRQVAKMISDNLSSNITVDAAAESVGKSASSLQKLFHKALGCGVGTYIRKHKILHTARLLKSTDMNISEISASCGFDSPYSFSRTFKAVMNLSPREFRYQPRL